MKSAVHAPGYQDFAAGDVFRTYRRTVTESDLVTFTQLAYMKLPIFVDEDWARRESPYGGRIVPGFLVCAVTAGMMESVLGANTLAGLAMDSFRFKAPVRPGDTLQCEVRIDSVKPTTDGKRGVVDVAMRVLNHREEEVLSYTSKVLVKGREA